MLAPTQDPHRGLRLPVTLYAGDVPEAWRHALQSLPPAAQARVAVLNAEGLRLSAWAQPEAAGALGAAAGRLHDTAPLRAAVQACAAHDSCDALWVQLPPEADPTEWAAWFDTAPGVAADNNARCGTGGPDGGGADLCCLEAVVACLNARHLAGELARDTLFPARLAQVEFATRLVLLAEAGLAPPARQALRQWLQAWNPATPPQTHFMALAPAPAAWAPTAAAAVCAPCTSLGLPACPPGSRVLSLLQPASLDLATVAARAGWAHVLDGRPWPQQPAAAAGSAPLQTLLFEARDPFHPQRLLELLCRPVPGLLRLHGHGWLATRPDWVVAFSGHQRLLSVEPAGRWWAARPASRWPKDAAARQALLAASIEPWGDRCQRLAFIGTPDFDAAAMHDALAACQLRYDDTHSEIVAWRGLRDPLPAWYACDDEEDKDEDQDEDTEYSEDPAGADEVGCAAATWPPAAARAGMR